MKNKVKFLVGNSNNKRKKDLSTDILKLLRDNVDAQNNLEEFNLDYKDSVFDDYLELVIQFGFVSLFAISFPLTPLISLITNIFEMEVDKYKLLKLYKRPIPYGAKSIGSWMNVIEIISYLSIFTNLGLLCFSTNTFYELSINYKFVIFGSLSIFYCAFKIILDKILPDVPTKIQELNKRLKHVSEKLFMVYLKKETKYSLDKKVDFNIYVSN